MKLIRSFTSKRNEVFLAQTGSSLCVVKRFADREDAKREREIYSLLSESSLLTAKLLFADECELRLSYIEGTNFTELLEQQEEAGAADFAPWEALAGWLDCFHKRTGLVMGDCNLRNFICGTDGRAFGLDFEECCEGSFLTMASSVCAFVQLYHPEKTPLKLSVSDFLQGKFAEYTGISRKTIEEETERQEAVILERRNRKKYGAAFSAVILAGGKSSRMGRNKAELELDGMTFAEYQVKKLRTLGFEDVILSGYERPVAGARSVPDIYLQKGPLGGIYAGLCAAENENCFVVSVDVPLCPKDTITALLDAHAAGKSPITVLEHNGFAEPLIGVYSRSLCSAGRTILETDRTSVKSLFDIAGFSTCAYAGDEAAIQNCNTPEEYKKMTAGL